MVGKVGYRKERTKEEKGKERKGNKHHGISDARNDPKNDEVYVFALCLH